MTQDDDNKGGSDFDFSLHDAWDVGVRYLTGRFPYCPEAIAVGMALQGALAVRRGPNKNGTLHWFHAFVLSTLAAFAGGTLNPIWLGQPSGILTNDVFLAVSIVAFVLVNYTPGDVGFLLFQTTPVYAVIVSLAQLFRSLGTIKFLTACYQALKDSPSAYYPMPVFGPILYGILLGNMGPLVLKGLEAHVGNGVPWAVQNGTFTGQAGLPPRYLPCPPHTCTWLRLPLGLFVAPFYHFYVHDHDGWIGPLLRRTMPIAQMVDLDDKTFAQSVVSLFMQIMGILQMPQFLGPSFTPFGTALLTPFFDPSTWTAGKYQGAYAAQQKEQSQQQQQQNAKSLAGEQGGPPVSKTKKKKKKKKTS